MRERYSISSTKAWILFANWAGLIISAIGAITLIYLLFTETPIFVDSNATITNEEWNQYVLWYSTALFGVCFSLASCAFIIHFTKTTDDITFINNRYILVLFSLSVGGLFTPIILSRLPNVDIQTTMTPRISISKGYGIILLAAGIPTFAYLASMVQWNNLFANSDSYLLATSIFMIVSIAAIVWGLINFSLFMGKNASERYEKSGLRILMIIVSTINLILATITLVWIILLSILTIFQLIGELFNRRGGFLSTMVNSMLISFRIAVQVFIIYTAWKCIIGIWQKDNFSYKHNENFATKEADFLSSQNR